MFRFSCVFCAWLLAVTPVLEGQSVPDLRLRLRSPSIALLLNEPQVPAQPGQVAPVPKLFIKILDGEGAVNNIKARTAREPVVEVDDENHKPVAGALVTFMAPHGGAGGTFNGQAMLQTVTDSSGRATGRGFMPNRTSGQFEIAVTATVGAAIAHAVITMTNQAGAGGSSSSSVGATRVGIFGGKGLIVLGAIAAAATVGAVVATRGGPPSATIAAPTTVTVGPTH